MKKASILFFCIFLFYNCQSSKSFSTKSWLVTHSYNVTVEYEETNSMLYTEMIPDAEELWQVINTYAEKLTVEQGYKYKLSFDTWADKKAVLSMDIFNSEPDDYISYVKGYVTNFLISEQKQNYQFEFLMTEAADNEAELSFTIINNSSIKVNIGNVVFEKLLEKEAEKPLVTVMDFQNVENSNYLIAVCESLTNIMTDTLNNIGKYNYFENEGWLEIDAMKEYSSVNNIDNIIFGQVYLDEAGLIQVEAFVYDNSQQRVTISESGIASNIFEAFDVAEELVVTLLEGFSNIHIAYGNINIVNKGSYEYKTIVYLDNRVAGENIYEISNVFIGEHNIRIVQQAQINQYVLYAGNINILEDEISEIEVDVGYIDEVYNGIKIDIGQPGQEAAGSWIEWSNYISPGNEVEWISNPDNGHFYASIMYEDLRTTSIYEDERYAVSLGAHIVTINNLEENRWLAEHFPKGKIGYTDMDNEDAWKWISGDNSQFTHWYPNEPDGRVLESFVELSRTQGSGLWSDEKQFDNFIIEWSPYNERPLNAFFDFAFTIKIESEVEWLSFDKENPVLNDCVKSVNDELVIVIMGLERGNYSLDLLCSNFGLVNSVFDVLLEDSRRRKPEVVLSNQSVDITGENLFKYISLEFRSNNLSYAVITLKSIRGEIYLNGLRLSKVH